RYLILDVLGSGTFGQVVKCRNTKTQAIVAVKVVKNKLAYFKQSMMEVAILEMLNQRYDAQDKHHLLRLQDSFIHKKHLCLVFELLSVNLYELIKQNHFRGLSTNLVRVFTAQILDALTVLNEARIIHCDLKPENILLKNLESPTLKIIDFGSACHEVQTMYTYIQSRFYRSPEVLVGLPYTSAIDMWSLGCIAAELFLGLPLFPGSSEYNQLSRIVEMLGTPPNYMVEVGKNAHTYFERAPPGDSKKYQLKSIQDYSREEGKSEQPSKRYFSASTLPDLINSYPMMRKAQMTQKEIEKERWSPQQAKQHPFITGETLIRPFQPPFIVQKQQDIIPTSSTSSSNLTSTTNNNNNNNNNTYTAAARPQQQQQQQNKRSSYIPPLPSIQEPPHLYQEQQQQQQYTPYQNPIPLMEMSTSNMNLAIPPPPPSSHTTGTGGGNRPRANTVGTVQVPPQIQWATVDHGQNNNGQFYSPYHPYGNQQQQQQQQYPATINVESMHHHHFHQPEEEEEDLLPVWNNRVDLERDGTWANRKAHHHRRSNSSTMNENYVQHPHRSSFHRLMRGGNNRQQDLEWDGVISEQNDNNNKDGMIA
ncbi:kinase-like protein, partial [Backusella circina FSU 941]